MAVLPAPWQTTVEGTMKRPDRETVPYAVVFSLDSMNGLQTCRTLARRGVPVIAISGNSKHPASRTSACERIIFADARSDDVIDVLEALGPTLESKAVLFPCNDLNVLPVSRHRQRLEPWYHIMLPDADVVEMLMHKTSFHDYGAANGWPLPRTLLLRDRSDAERAAGELMFPCILKPSTRTLAWARQNPQKAFRVHEPGELPVLYDRYSRFEADLVVQEWVEGPESNLFTCYCYFSREAEPLVTFVTRKLRQWPPELGEGCLGEECRNDEVLAETVRLFREAGLRGLGYLEMKQDARTGTYFVIEPNIGRPTSKSSLAEASGVELVYTMYCDALGWELPAARQQLYRNAKWVYFTRDARSAYYFWRRGDLTLTDWARSWRGIKVDAMFSRHDQAPFWHELAGPGRRYLAGQVAALGRDGKRWLGRRTGA